jgi:hypothetical protein
MSKLASYGQREMRDVVDDSDGEAASRRCVTVRGVAVAGLARQLVEDGAHHRGREFLGREAVASADHARHRRERAVLHGLRERRAHVLVQRLAERAGLLGAIEHRDRLRAARQRREERGRGEGPVEADLEHADASRRARSRARPARGPSRRPSPSSRHALGLGVADVVEEAVAAARERREARHGLRHERGQLA